MKFKILVLSLIFTSLPLIGQQLGTAPVGEAGLFGNAYGGNPMLNLVMMELRGSGTSQYLGETVGSPYLNEEFVKSQIFYGDEPQGNFFIRYNALNSVIEIKQSELKEEEAKRLYPDKKVRVKYGNRELRFTTFITKKDETKNGYLSLIHDGKELKLYHRLAVKFSEGKVAANSMVADIPNRFAHFVEYYYQKKDTDRIDQLSQKKGKFLKHFDKDTREKLKTYIKENNIGLDKEDDLIKIFGYINSLNS